MEMVKELLEKGANTKIQDRDGYIPLTKAEFYGHFDICELLSSY
jgi:ankyrin repeat protein